MSSVIGKRCVCRVEVSRVEWNFLHPWQRTPQSKSTGTAFVIEGKKLLTNAHVVRSATDIRIRPHGSTRRYPAEVLYFGPDFDLALLKIKGEQEEIDFFAENGKDHICSSGKEPDAKRKKFLHGLQFATDLPALHESVHVVGFPTGGNTICVTEGVVSRIDFLGFSKSLMLTIQIDAAINPGNSGGPALNSEGLVTGVAFSTKSHKKNQPLSNIGYLIPIDIVKNFLGRCQENPSTYALSPIIPYRFHSLENKSLRLAHAVPDTVEGVLLTSVCDSMKGFLAKGDVLTGIDDRKVSNDGQVQLRGDETIQHGYLLRGKFLDEQVRFSVFRNGEHVISSPAVLRYIPTICPRWESVDYFPDYLILGTVVLLPMSTYLQCQKGCGTRLSASTTNWCQKWPHEWEGKEGLVVLTEMFSHEVCFGYNRPYWRFVETYNDIPIKCLAHLRDLWEESMEQAKESDDRNGDSNSAKTFSFVRLGLEHSDDIVFEVRAAIQAQADILKQQHIPCPSNITQSNPRYKS
ncbi:unnamed protein product [Cylindrotheca closterium]|uniref:Protease Do-like PDZ domain-containing protein n=1 Tax=Cylindrotheca closterium TaxID=2856 RepID=A0AAD2GA45_9STRA|nr:unnamed protein product [Cylindrotheca closterium]